MSASAHIKQIASLHSQGWTYSELAEAFGTTRSAIAGLCYRNGIDSGGRRSKLSADQARDIRKRAEAGETYASIARRYSISANNVYSITSRRTFADVA